MISISLIHIENTFASMNHSWLNDMSNIIVNPIVLLILTCIIFLGFLYQLYSKKINILGILASLALLILFLGFLISGEVNLISILLFFIGIILLTIELFIVGAVIGIIGIVLIIVSMIMLGDNILVMLFNVIVALILSIIEWVILVRVFNRKIPFFDKVVLNDSTSTEAGYRSHDDRSYLVGKIAYTTTDLRPAGIITLDDKRIDAVSDGTFILRNKKVKILEVEGSRVVVREIKI
ncbi:serine protease [Staphylococcus hominis]|uniref:NfeD family protein n=1 Tax=Staphylococcus hominis TaxID=1290 RepID=UPI000D1F90E6|nr:NfeD family protein [Staphylococcus hominis]PTK36810.1 serine protease [Staphylococcus hominis]RIO49252.1 serine protease [Staphylococcus hominis]